MATDTNRRWMRAAALTGPRKLEIVDVPKPESGDDVVMRITACGICGSDLHYWEMGTGAGGTTGLILGHEFVGTVFHPGVRSDLSFGERVTALPADPCGTCSSCIAGLPNLCSNFIRRRIPGNTGPGAYAEYLSVRSDMVRKIPVSMTDLEASLIEPASVALHAVKKAAIRTGDRVLIVGGGPIGLLCAAWARIQGAGLIILAEIDDFRKSFAKGTGYVDQVVDAADPALNSKLKKMTGGGFDAALEASASDGGLNLAISLLRMQGRLVLAGISFHPQSVSTLMCVVKEVEIRSSYAYLSEEFDIAIDFIAEKKLAIENLVTRTIPLASVQDTFESLSGKNRDIKVVIYPQQDS